MGILTVLFEYLEEIYTEKGEILHYFNGLLLFSLPLYAVTGTSLP